MWQTVFSGYALMPEHGALATGAPGGRGRAAQHGLPPQGGQAAGARPRPALGGAPPPPLRAAPRPQLHSAARVLACNGRIPATARAGRAPGPIAAASCHPGAQAGLATQANPRDHSYATELPHAAAHTHAVVGGPAGARTPPKAGGGGGAAGGLAPAPAPAGARELDGGAGRLGASRCEPASCVMLKHMPRLWTRAGAWQRAGRRRARPAACNSRPARVAVVNEGRPNSTRRSPAGVWGRQGGARRRGRRPWRRPEALRQQRGGGGGRHGAHAPPAQRAAVGRRGWRGRMGRRWRRARKRRARRRAARGRGCAPREARQLVLVGLQVRRAGRPSGVPVCASQATGGASGVPCLRDAAVLQRRAFIWPAMTCQGRWFGAGPALEARHRSSRCLSALTAMRC